MRNSRVQDEINAAILSDTKDVIAEKESLQADEKRLEAELEELRRKVRAARALA